MLDVKSLRVLREVAAKGSFSAAADSLAYTQSAVSQQIAALEREAQTKLVERSARGVRLTEAGPGGVGEAQAKPVERSAGGVRLAEGGRALVRHADGILARLADAEAELEAIA